MEKLNIFKFHITQVILVLLISVSCFGQNLARWYPMSTEESIENAPCIYSSRNLSYLDSTFIDLESIPENFSRPSLSYITLAAHAMDDSHLYKGRLYGVRGIVEAQEVLIIDADQDWSFDDEKVVLLPALDKDPSIDYNELFQYPTGLNYNYRLHYDYVMDEEIFDKSSQLGITVLSKFDSVKNNLYYIDKFKLCFNQELVANIKVEEKVMEVRCPDYLPWISTVRFSIRSEAGDKMVNIKDPFIQTDEHFYTIDSVDFINEKILIRKESLDKEKTVSFQSESLFSKEVETTDSKSNSEFRIVHVWGSWCRPCLRNMPKLIELQKQNQELEVIGICVDGDKDKAQQVAKDKSIDWRNLFFKFDEFDQESDLNVITYPTYFILNDQNKVIDKVSSIDKLEDRIDELSK